MKLNLNPKYIQYKVLFITSSYFQQINEKAVELFIMANDQSYFPEFIFYHITKDVDKSYLNRAVINIRRIAYIVDEVLQLTLDKCNEIKA